MNGDVINKLNNYLSSAQAITDVTHYSLYARIGDYVEYLEKEPSLRVVLEDMDKNASLHESLNKLKELKEVIDAPDVLLDGWEKERGLDALRAIEFAFRHGGIKSLKNRSTEAYNKKREIGLKSEDYMGHLTNVHYALLRTLQKEKDTEADTNKAVLKRNKDEITTKVGQTGGKAMGYLVYKNQEYPIGGVFTQKFKLLKSLTDPHLGVTKIVHTVFSDMGKIKVKKDFHFPHAEREYHIRCIRQTLKDINGELPRGLLYLTLGISDDRRSVFIRQKTP